MNRRVLFLLIIASLATALVGQSIYAQDRSDHPLIKGVTDAKVTLQQGLTAAAQQGRPISAKFEVEDGKFLSFPKIPSGVGFAFVRQNHRIVENDARDPADARNVGR